MQTLLFSGTSFLFFNIFLNYGLYKQYFDMTDFHLGFFLRPQ